jgi:MraZ protein
LFRGINSINLDEKGRMAVPTRYRADLQELSDGKVVITAGLDKCLVLYPLPEFEQLQHKLEKLPMFDINVRKLKRLLVGHAADCELDGQGRFLIPEPLRNLAGLEKKVALIGQGKVFEIWNEDLWNRSRDEWLDVKNLENLRELSPELGALTL